MDRSISGFVVLFSVCVSLSGQWLHYPTAGIPRTPDGKPNLSAPAPKTPDGKPDLSGIWQWLRKPGLTLFLDLTPNVAQPIPYKPEWGALAKARGTGLRNDEPLSNCMPMGIVEQDTIDNTLWKIVQIPGLVVILHEWNVAWRQIFTDGRPFPEDMQPAWDGYSVGKWDGDTLVVQTTGFRETVPTARTPTSGIWLDTAGDPLTEAGKVTERFRRLDFGHLDIEITIDDPKAYTKPWTFTTHEILVPDTELMESVCKENEQDIEHLNAVEHLNKAK
jgi:hypothetical protein